MLGRPILNKAEVERALFILSTECKRVKSCPLDNPLYKVAIAALTRSTDPSHCPFSKDCEQVEVEDWREVCKPKIDSEGLSNLAAFLSGAAGSLTYRLFAASKEPLKPSTMESEQPNTWKELARKLTQDCHHPLRPCPMKCSTRQHLYEEHGINLRKRCPFFVLDCASVTEKMWEAELLLAEVKREALKK